MDKRFGHVISSMAKLFTCKKENATVLTPDLSLQTLHVMQKK
jgi:hypothetical protein